MPSYCIHIQNWDGVLLEEPIDLPNETAVQEEIVRAASELLSSGLLEEVFNGQPRRIWATDQPGAESKSIASIEITAK